jgi:small subunit ribosomal protein S9
MAEKKKSKAVKKTTKKKKAAPKKAEAKKAKPVKAVGAEVPAVPSVPVPPPPFPALQSTEPAPEAAVPQPSAPEPEIVFAPKPKKEKLPKGHKYYGTGRRKEAVAKVWLTPGSGRMSINGKSLKEYFCGRQVLEYQILRPLVVTNTRESYDVHAEALGGGIPGQAGALSLGIARALLEVSPDLRVKLKREGLLRRDPRMKERKKYGLKRARRAFQYTKR